MAGIALSATPFTDVLPESVRHAPEFVAAAATLDAMLYLGDVETGNVLIWSRIAGLEEPILTNLAAQLHLEGYEGWQMAETLEEKRQLVKDSIKLHFYKGTRYTLERIAEILDLEANIVEWWEAPDDPTFWPYEFDIDVEAFSPRKETLYYDLLDMIQALKNVRSHRRQTKVVAAASGRTPYLAAATVAGLTVTVQPLGEP